MGQSSGAYVDTAAIRGIADRVAGIEDVITHSALRGLQFGAATAGWMSVADGAALSRAVDGFAEEMTAWARAVSEIAIGLRCGADRYVDAEHAAAARVG